MPSPYKTSKDRYEHRVIASKALGRELIGKEVVHHIDYNKRNNSNNNLVICPDNSYHKLLHARTDAYLAGVSLDTHSLCSVCKEYHTRDMFPKSPSKLNGLYNICKKESNRIRREKQYSKGKFNWLARLRQQYNKIKKLYTKREICWITKEGSTP